MIRRFVFRLSSAVAILLCVLSGVLAADQEQGLRLFRQGQYEAAAEHLATVVKQSPNDLGTRYWLGRAQYGAREYEAARDTFMKILEVKPTSVESRYWLALCCERVGDLGAARVALETVLAAKHDFAPAQEALKRVEAALAAAPKVPEEPSSSPAGPGLVKLPDALLAFRAHGLPVTPDSVTVQGRNVYDYTFASAPADWVVRGGIWEATNRWTCSPQWSWLGGYSRVAVASLWNKREFEGDVTVELYAGMKMGLGGTTQKYKNPSDINICIHGDGANLDSGYNFMIGANLNTRSCIMKGTKTLGETRAAEHLLPIFEDGFPRDMYEFHRRWFAVRARKRGNRLQLYLDNRLAVDVEDPEPLSGGRVALWTNNNGIIIARAKIYYERERHPRTPVPGSEAIGAQVSEIGPAPVRLVSATHPSCQNDFEASLGTWRPRPTMSRSNDPAVANGLASERQEAWITLDAPGAGGSGHCLKIVNPNSGGDFAVTVTDEDFDPRRAGRLSFDYRVPRGVLVNLFAKVSGELYEIVFTGRDSPSPAAQILGYIRDVKADNNWHHATFNLRGHLDRVFGFETDLRVQELFFANRNNDDYLMCGFGGNHAGATWWVDNFRLGGTGGDRVELAWQPRKGAEAPERYALVVDDQPDTEPTSPLTTELSRTIADLPPGAHYAHLRPQLAGGTWGGTIHYRFYVDTAGPKVTALAPRPGSRAAGPYISARLTDEDGVGVDPRPLRLTVNGHELDVDHVALSYDPTTDLLQFDPALADLHFADGQQVQVALAGLQDYVGHAATELPTWSFTMDYGKDRTPPAPPALGDQLYLCDDTFEQGLGQWRTYGGSSGALVCRDPSTKASGRYSLRLYNYLSGGRFGAYIRQQPFDAGKYRLVSFDYKVNERLRSDFVAYVNGDMKAVVFTDNDDDRTLLGAIPNVIRDNQWHHAEFDLYQMLRAQDPEAHGYRVERMFLGDWGWQGNAAGATYHLDNFRIIPVLSADQLAALKWRASDISGITGYSWVVDRRADTMPDEQIDPLLEAADLSSIDAGDAYLHVRACDGAGNWGPAAHYRLLIDSRPPQVALLSPADGATVATSTIEYELRDEGIAGINPESLKMVVNGREYTISSGAIAYDPTTHRLTWDGQRARPKPIVLPDKQRVRAELTQAEDYAGNAAPAVRPISFTMDYSRDREPPRIAGIKSTTHQMTIYDTFETDLGEWANLGGAMGAKVERDQTTAATGKYSVRLTNQREGGNMAAVVCPREVNVARYPAVSFDYRVDPDVKIDLVLKIEGEEVALGFTDAPEGIVARVPGVKADGQWHHASFDLASLLRKRRRRGALRVQEIVFKDRNRMDNRVGATLNIDNFFVGRVGRAAPSFSWSCYDATGVKGYSYELDQNCDTVPDTTSEGPATTKAFGPIKGGMWFFHLRALDGAGNWGPPTHYPLLHLGLPPIK